MEMTEQALREAVEKLIFKLGEEGAISYISSGDYDLETKEKAIKMIKYERDDSEMPMAENGDISDMGL